MHLGWRCSPILWMRKLRQEMVGYLSEHPLPRQAAGQTGAGLLLQSPRPPHRRLCREARWGFLLSEGPAEPLAQVHRKGRLEILSLEASRE